MYCISSVIEYIIMEVSQNILYTYSATLAFSGILCEIINLEGHLNRISDSKVMVILLNRWILPIGGVASGRVCDCSLRSRLVFEQMKNNLDDKDVRVGETASDEFCGSFFYSVF